jgi:hypothetical protein
VHLHWDQENNFDSDVAKMWIGKIAVSGLSRANSTYCHTALSGKIAGTIFFHPISCTRPDGNFPCEMCIFECLGARDRTHETGWKKWLSAILAISILNNHALMQAEHN